MDAPRTSSNENKSSPYSHLLRTPPALHTPNGVPVFLSPEVYAESMKSHLSGDNQFKTFFKKWPWIYSILYFVVGPSLMTGVTPSRFVKRFQHQELVLHAGAGTKQLPGNVIDVDIFAFAGIDVVADLQSLPFLDNVFDAVTCDQVLEHVPAPHAVIAELVRVTKPGGLIHVAMPFLFPWHPSPSDFSRWTLEGQRSLFQDCAVVEQGVMAGPFSALTAFAAAFLATILCFGSQKVQSALQYIFLLLLAPVKLADFLFAHMPGAQLCSANFYTIVRKL